MQMEADTGGLRPRMSQGTLGATRSRGRQEGPFPGASRRDLRPMSSETVRGSPVLFKAAQPTVLCFGSERGGRGARRGPPVSAGWRSPASCPLVVSDCSVEMKINAKLGAREEQGFQ